MKCTGWCALALLAGALGASGGRAQDEAVLLHVPDCLGVSGAEVKKLVALELAPRLRVVEAGEASALLGRVTCTAPRVSIRVEDAARATPLAIELDLEAAAPEARERLLALALAELIGTRLLERGERARMAETEPEGQEPVDDEDAAPPMASAAQLQLWIAPSIALTAEPMTPLFGGALGAAYALNGWLLGLDLEARFGRDTHARSDVALGAYSLALSASPLLLRSPLQLSAGVALRAGYAQLTASANDAALASDALENLWLGPAAQLALQLPFAAHTALRLALEAGYHVRPIIGLDEAGAERFALRGTWLSLSLGLALGLI